MINDNQFKEYYFRKNFVHLYGGSQNSILTWLNNEEEKSLKKKEICQKVKRK